MVGAPTRVWLAEPVHFRSAIRGIQVPERGESTKARARPLQILDTDEDVDDRLRREAGHRCAAYMVDTAHDPIADRSNQCSPLLLEARGPSRIVGRDLDRFVFRHGHRRYGVTALSSRLRARGELGPRPFPRTSCSSARRRSAGYCFVPDCERVRVNGGAAPTVLQGRPRGHEANPLLSPREGIGGEPARRPGKRG